MKGMIELYEQNITFLGGFDFSGVAIETGNVGTVYGIAQATGIAAAQSISDKSRYPYFSRVSSPQIGQIQTLMATLLYFKDITKCSCWTNVGLITSTNLYDFELAQLLINNVMGTSIKIVTYQQFLFQGPLSNGDSSDYELELRELKDSGARVIFAPIYFRPWSEFIIAANEYGLVNENYVWITASALTGTSNFSFLSDEVLELSRGMLGVTDYFPQSGSVYDDFVTRWASLDPVEYPGAGNGYYPHYFTQLGYDFIFAVARTVEKLDATGELYQTKIPPETWVNTFRSIEFEGVTGNITINKQTGDRISDYSLNYYDTDNRRWVLVAKWSEENGIEFFNEIVWFSNTTNIPDIDIRPPFDYWSCHDKKERTDETGKTIQLHTPDGSDIDDIDIDYYCDSFIDCKNLSDETSDGCQSNYLIIFIVFGIITGILIILSFLLLLFVILFGLILKYQRLRVSSPFFLIIIIISIIIGYSSIFAWFGKPNSVACGFQPWLLGLSTASMIIALCTKTFRIWRIFRSELKLQRITDFELLGIWFLFMLPVLLILVIWTIVSTPTATMKERDGYDHYICTTGGFTGEPGGIIFFFILVAYCSFTLLIGVFLSIVTRKVPSLFNESKLLAISIYNLGFLAAVIIPVFLVVQPYDPFVAWILRTIAILYAFTATLVMQFFPPVFGIILFDRFKNRNLASKTEMLQKSSSSFSK